MEILILKLTITVLSGLALYQLSEIIDKIDFKEVCVND